MMGTLLAVGVGGGIGALARYYMAGGGAAGGRAVQLGHLCRQHHGRAADGHDRGDGRAEIESVA